MRMFGVFVLLMIGIGFPIAYQFSTDIKLEETVAISDYLEGEYTLNKDRIRLLDNALNNFQVHEMRKKILFERDKIFVFGYSSSETGSLPRNSIISEKRSDCVRQYIIGVSSAKMVSTSIAVGEKRHVEIKLLVEGKEFNDFVEKYFAFQLLTFVIFLIRIINFARVPKYWPSDPKGILEIITSQKYKGVSRKCPFEKNGKAHGVSVNGENFYRHVLVCPNSHFRDPASNKAELEAILRKLKK